MSAASSTTTRGRIYLSPISVQEYVSRGENIPVDIEFSGENPSISFQVGNGLLKDFVPITTQDLQKCIYEHGQRYIKKWDLRFQSKKLAAQRKQLIVGTVALVLAVIIILAAWYFLARRRSGGVVGIPAPATF